MSGSSTDDTFLDTVRQALEEDAQDLDREVAARLRTTRRQALSAGRRPTGARRFWPLRLPGTVAAMTAAAAVILILSVSTTDRLSRFPGPGPSPAEVDILASQDSLELYEDLEFYLWLAAERNDAG